MRRLARGAIASLVVAAGAALAVFVGRGPLRHALAGYATTESDDVRSPPPSSASWSPVAWGAFDVFHADFGTLTTENLRTNAVPWKLVAVLPDVVPEAFFAGAVRGFRPAHDEPLRRFGFVYGATLRGSETPPQVHDYRDSPVGYVHGTVHRGFPSVTLELAASMCSTCHGGRTWDEHGQPTSDVVWGVPNHSIDFDAYIAAITAAVTDARATDDAIVAAMRARFPAVTSDEIATYTRYVLPAFRSGIRDSTARWGRLHPWTFGGPGMSHGVAIVHESQSPAPDALSASDFPPAFTKEFPNVFGVTAKHWMLIDGSYTSATADRDGRFVDFLTGFLPVLGASPERAVAERGRLAQVVAFLEAIEPPTFPGPIDAESAARGRAIYESRCQSCHGGPTPDGGHAYPNRRVAAASVGTDPTRATALAGDAVARFNATAVGRYMSVEPTGAYMPPSLRGVWAQAPYFHNGSVPTLWAVLTPADRPTRFWVGGHALDLRKVGIALDASGEYPKGYEPWSEPAARDTAAPGFSNRGHEFGTQDLTDAMKWDLVEYLKTL